MKKTIISILLLLIILVAPMATIAEAAAKSAENFKQNEIQSTSFSSPTDAGEEFTLDLFMPDSYEQYLQLESPSDFAISDDYIAVADKPATGNSIIYLLDRKAQIPQYRVYEHDTAATLSSLQLYKIGEETHLYFVASGTSTTIHHFACAAEGEFSAINTEVSCTSFLIANGYLFYATVTGGNVTIARMDMNGFEFTGSPTELTMPSGIQTGELGGITPYFTQNSATTGNNKIYFSLNSVICSITGDATNATEEQWKIDASIRSFAVVSSNKVFYSTTANNYPLYVYDGKAEPITRNGEGVTKVPTMHMIGDTLYFICGSNIQTLNAASHAFNDYEIGKYSVSKIRLGGKADIASYDGKLVIADSANRRVTIYEASANSYTYLNDLPFAPSAVCAGKEDFVIADNESNQLYIYRYDNLSSPAKIERLGGDLIDGVYLFDTYYLLTNGTSHGAILKKENESYTLQTSALTGSYSKIAADIYGNLYLMNGGAVYPVQENDFITGKVGESLYSFGNAAIDLAVDYAGTIYALTSSSVLSYNRNSESSYDLTQQLNSIVYSKTTPAALGFTFDYMDGRIYLLSDGYIAIVNGIEVASLRNLSAEGIYNDFFTAAPTENSYRDLLVSVPAGTVLVDVDEESLKNNSMQTLPCGEYKRLNAATSAVVLAKRDFGTLVMIYTYDEQTKPIRRDYDICLIPGNQIQYIDSQAYFTAMNGSAQTSNVIGMYRFPVMRTGKTADEGNTGNTYEPFARMSELARGQKLTLLGKVSYGDHILDSDYYFVSVSDENGTHYGFVPAGYVLLNGNGNIDTTQFSYRKIDKGESITLANINNPEDTIVLSHGEQVKLFTESNFDGKKYVEYVTKNGTTVYGGWIDESKLYEATPSIISVLVVVTVVTAVVLLSVCYLLLRKQPTLQ